MNKENLQKYLELTKQEEEIKKQKDELAAIIKEELNKDGGVFEDDELKATLTPKVTFKYTDEVAIISYIKQKGLSSQYIVEKINGTALNKQLKESETLSNALKPYYTSTITLALSVKEKEE